MNVERKGICESPRRRRDLGEDRGQAEQAKCQFDLGVSWSRLVGESSGPGTPGTPVIPRTTHTWPLKLPLSFRLLIWLQAARHRPRLLRPKPRPFKFHSGHDYLVLESVLWC